MTSRRTNRALERSYHSFTDDVLANVDFIDCNFANADFATCDIKNVTFNHCDLSYAKFPTTLLNVTFTNSTLTKADFSESYLYVVHFEPHNADARLFGALVPQSTTTPCTLPKYHLLASPPSARSRVSVVRPDLVAIVNSLEADPVSSVSLLTSATALVAEHPELSAASLHTLLGALKATPVGAL